MEKICFEQLPEMMALLIEKVERLESLLLNQKEEGTAFKEMLTIDEAADYIGISKSSLYKMNMNSELPTYRPGGKRVYLKRSEIDQWMMSQRRSSQEEIAREVQNPILKNPRRS